MAELTTPVLFVNFNRPDTTRQTFARIREARPKKLYVAVDGPREHKGEAEVAKVQEVREIFKDVDWDCDLKTLFREENVGCKEGVRTAIDWMFETETEGIILEDDCLPDLSFFGYCQELLERYKEDDRIMVISGDNMQRGTKRGNASYYFSRFPHIWGWATWKRAWDKYDRDLTTYSDFKESGVAEHVFNNVHLQNYWLRNFDQAASGLDTWDYQWVYSLLINNGLTINPNVNLISNIGFHAEATHTTYYDPAANLPTQSIGELTHPKFIVPNKAADDFSAKEVFRVYPRTPLQKIKSKVKSVLRRFI